MIKSAIPALCLGFTTFLSIAAEKTPAPSGPQEDGLFRKVILDADQPNPRITGDGAATGFVGRLPVAVSGFTPASVPREVMAPTLATTRGSRVIASKPHNPSTRYRTT